MIALNLEVWINEALIPYLDMVLDMVTTQRLGKDNAIQLVVSVVNLEVLTGIVDKQEDIGLLEAIQDKYLENLLTI